jgi:hypothetical protein
MLHDEATHNAATAAAAHDALAAATFYSVAAVCCMLCQPALQERAKVAVLRRLPEFGVQLLPAQLTHLPDRKQLLHRVLLGRQALTSSKTTGAGSQGDGVTCNGIRKTTAGIPPWRRLGDVLELAALLGMGNEEDQHEVCVLTCH